MLPSTYTRSVMDSARLLTVLPILRSEIAGTTGVLREVERAILAKNSSQLLKARAEAQDYLRSAPSTQFVPSWLHLVRRIGGHNLHAREVLRRLSQVLDNEDLKPKERAALIESIIGDLDEFETLIVQLQSALSAVGETKLLIPVDKAAFGVLYPSEFFGDFEEFAREMAELNRHVRPLAEVCSDLAAPALSSLETGSFQVFLTVGTATGAIIATIVWRLLRTWKQIEEIRKLRAETRKVDAEASDLLDKRAQRQREEAVEKIHKDVMSQCDASIDATRRNELSIAVKQSIAFVDTRIQMNVLFEVGASDMPARQTPAGEREQKETKLIRERGAAMWEVQASLARPLLAADAKSVEQEEVKDSSEEGA